MNIIMNIFEFIETHSIQTNLKVINCEHFINPVVQLWHNRQYISGHFLASMVTLDKITINTMTPSKFQIQVTR